MMDEIELQLLRPAHTVVIAAHFFFSDSAFFVSLSLMKTIPVSCGQDGRVSFHMFHMINLILVSPPSCVFY